MMTYTELLGLYRATLQQLVALRAQSDELLKQYEAAVLQVTALSAQLSRARLEEEHNA